MNALFILLLFWSSIPISLLLSILGIAKDRYWLVIIGAILLFPISYYLNGSPALHGYALFLPVFQVISGAAVREGGKTWAWLFLLPAFLMVLWFLLVVISYQIL